jgi:hypothetical protein
MITKEQIEEWRMKSSHYNIRENLGKTRTLLLEILDAVEANHTTNVQAPAKVRGNSKKK